MSKIRTIYQEVQEALSEKSGDYMIQDLNDGGPITYLKKPQEISSERLAHIYSFRHGFISNSITIKKIRKILRYYSPSLFIDAQTGAGKTTFIFTVLYLIAKERGMKILILSNRKMIKNKIKYDAINVACPEVKELLTSKGIEKEHHFGDIDIYSYQDFLGDFNYRENREYFEKTLKEYAFIIFDEIHFFVSDASYNVFSGTIFQYLINLAYVEEIPRIYLTGTPDPIFNIIHEYEAKALDGHWLGGGNKRFLGRVAGNGEEMPYFHYAHYARDYSYLDVKQFSSDEEIITSIMKSHDKWLVFVDSRSRAEKFMDKLKDKKVSFLNSTNITEKENEEVVRSIVDHDRFDCDVLLTTTVLDVGINIKDSVNIVSYLTERNSFIQAIGRKRRASAKERVILFIPQHAKQEITKRINQAEQEIRAIKENIDLLEGKLMNGTCVPEHFFISNGRYLHNDFAVSYYRSFIDDWKSVVSEETPEEIACDMIFQHILGWINKKPKTTRNMDEELLEIIETYRGRVLSEAEYEVFAEKLRPYDQRKDQRKERTEGTFKTQTINKIIKPMGFCLSVNGTDKKIVEMEEK